MTATINGVMLAVGSSLAVLIVVKVTIVTALGLAVAWLARRNRAAVRHALLAITFGATLVLPLASIVAPPVHIAVPVVGVNRAALPPVVDAGEPVPLTAADGAVVTPATPQASEFSLSILLLAGWIVGTAVFLVPVVTGLWQIRSLRRSGLPWLDGQSIAETLALDTGIHRRVEVLLHEALPGPITCGVLDPAVLLPADAESWAREDLSRAIVHELEHIRRGDSATRCLARAVCALYWFHPLAWIAWRKLVPAARRSPLLAMANHSDLSARVGAVLDSRQRRGRAGTFSLAMACAGAVLLVVAVSPLTLVGAPQAIPTQTVIPSQSDAAPVKSADPKVQGQQSHRTSDPARLVAQVQSPTVVATQTQPKLQFEVVSIHRCDENAGLRSGPARATPGLVTAECATLGGPFPGLISEAFGMFADGHRHSPTLSPPIEGGPSWINSERYTIIAKADGDPGEGLMIGPMLQGVLEDRFKLKLHHETREVPVYALTVSKGGSKLRAAEGPACVPATGKPCLSGIQVQGHNLVLNMRGTLARFAETLAASLDRPIGDKTGLSGTFDLHLEFAIDQVTTPAFAALASAGDPTGGVSIFTAIQEQLGLKLEPARGPGDFIVIDHVERPSEN